MVGSEPLIKYKELLKELKDSDDSHHLLLGNGFNRSIGVATKYEDICRKMMEMFPQYAEIESLFSDNDYDLEMVIKILQDLEDNIPNDKEDERKFLKKYIQDKFTLDFMKALYQIVHPQVNKIYKNINLRNDIYVLFENFSNFFTLNFDPLLYLLLMKFVDTKDNFSVAYGKNSPIRDLDEISESLLYSKVREWRTSGNFKTTTNVDNKSTSTDIEDANKPELTINFIRHYGDLKQQNNWTNRHIELAIQHVLNEENNQYLSKVDDGFRKYREQGIRLLFDHYNTTQNVFFLHGCLHMVDASDSNRIRKVQSAGINSLFDRIEKTLHDEGGKINCVLSGESDQKIEQINESLYLGKCYKELGDISGIIVILGCSLVGKDSHILSQLDRDEIKTLYFGTNKKGHQEMKRAIRKILPKKDIRFFDYCTMNFSTEN